MANCDVQALISRTSCFVCLPSGVLDIIEAELLCEILAVGTGGGGVPGATGGVFSGSGSPEGVVTAPVGSIYTDITGGVIVAQYTKVSGAGNTGWQ